MQGNELREQPVEIDKLAAFREVAAVEQAEKAERGKMSEAAKAKLRALGEHDRLDAESDTRLVKEFTSRAWTVEQLVDLFAKSLGGDSPRRRAIKAAHRLNQGATVYHIHDVSFFGELLPGEAEMPMSRFIARYSLPEDEMVTPVAGSTEGRPQKQVKVRPCKSAGKCIWAKRRKPASAVGKSLYCTSACQKCDMARRRRANNTTSTTHSSVGTSLAAA